MYLWPGKFQVLTSSSRLSFEARQHTRVSGARANQPPTLVLFEHMPNPAHRTPNREQGQASASRQLERLLQHGQRKINRRRATGHRGSGADDGVGQRQPWGTGIRVAEQSEQGCSARVALRVEPMPEAREPFTTP